jgi:hypothetical protein
VTGSLDAAQVGIEEYNGYQGTARVWLQIMDVTTNAAVAQRNVESRGSPQRILRAEQPFQMFTVAAPTTLFLRTATEISGCGSATQAGGAVYLIRVGG